jgi:CRISPR-associated protein Cas5d
VDYIISASLRMTPRAGPEDNLKKFEEMFARRLEKGQHFQSPYLGCREFVASVEPAPDSFEVHESLQNDRPLGLVFYDFDYPEKPGEKPRPLFFQARLTRGVMNVPPLAQVRAENLVSGGAA